MNGVMIRDVVFEQMYQKKIETIVDRAFYDGLMQGMSSVVAMVDHLQTTRSKFGNYCCCYS